MADDYEVVAVAVTLAESPALHAAIDSARESLRGVDHLVVVVHNSPSATGVDDREGVRWVGAGMNLGWAAGMHAGLLGTTSRFVWAIQDDLIVTPDSYGLLASALATDPGLGSVRGLPVDEKGLTHPGFAGTRITEDGLITGGLPPEPIPAHAYDPEMVGSYLPSSGQLIRREVWDQVGGFDPWIYPWGYIDIDFGRTLSHAGHGFRIVPQALMRHETHRSTNHPFRQHLIARNRWLFNEKWRGPEPDLDEPRADPAIVTAMRAGRMQPRDVDLAGLQRIAGVAGTDLALRLGRALPGMIGPVAAERDRLRAELNAVAGSRAWREVERLRRWRNRLPGGT